MSTGSPPIQKCFHSISFSSEWRHDAPQFKSKPDRVSIQLVSPASGDKKSSIAEVLSWLFPFN